MQRHIQTNQGLHETMFEAFKNWGQDDHADPGDLLPATDSLYSHSCKPCFCFIMLGCLKTCGGHNDTLMVFLGGPETTHMLVFPVLGRPTSVPKGPESNRSIFCATRENKRCQYHKVIFGRVALATEEVYLKGVDPVPASFPRQIRTCKASFGLRMNRSVTKVD